MTQYQWDDRLLTGYEVVDAQHRRLFALLQDLGENVGSSEIGLDRLRAAADALTHYAQEHFDDELEMMQKQRCDLRHVMMHVQEHGAFIRRVSLFQESLAEDSAGARAKAGELLLFLVQWLKHHIRVVDQVMARQLRRIADGASPADAYSAELAEHPDARSPQAFAETPKA
jgi:hemerythrin